MGVAGSQGVFIDLPFGMMLFCKTDQVFDLYLFVIVRNYCTVVAPKHLMDLTGDDSQICGGCAVFEWSKG